MQHTQLIQQLRDLRLSGMVNAFEQQIEQPATHNDLGFEERLSLLLDREVTLRNNNRIERLLKAARLKLLAYPEDVDYSHPRDLKKNVFASLLSGQWLEKHQNILITGPTGCGKTYLGCVLATQACQQGFSVRYFRTSRLLETLTISHGDGRYPKIIKQLAKTDLLVLDDWGLDQLALSHRNDLLEILEDRHGYKSTLVTSQLPVKKWHAAIGDATLADAILDRLLHNSHRLQLKGESMRRLMAENTNQSDQ